jgi:hypothetical protein
MLSGVQFFRNVSLRFCVRFACVYLPGDTMLQDGSEAVVNCGVGTAAHGHRGFVGSANPSWVGIELPHAT